MKSLLLLSIFSFMFGAMAQDLSDRTIGYSDLRVKCKTADKDLSLYFTAKGQLYRNDSNSATWAVYSKKYADWYVANKKMSTHKSLFGRYLARTINYEDPFGFKYQVQFEEKIYFTNGKKSKATLTRVHEHPEIKVNQKFELSCVTEVKVKKLNAKPITVGRFNRLKADHKAYVLGEIADVRSGVDVELTAKQKDLYAYYASTGTAESVYGVDKVKDITKAQKQFLTKLDKLETRDVKECIEDRLDYVDEEYREEALENWSICSYEIYVVRDVNETVIGFVVDRFNDNGVDDSDGHDGSVTIYNSKGKELSSTEWYP